MGVVKDKSTLSFRVVRATCGSLTQQTLMWVTEARRAQVSPGLYVVELSGERTQYSILGVKWGGRPPGQQSLDLRS